MSSAKGSEPAAFLRIACAPRPCRLGASALARPFERNILGFQNLDGHNAALELQIQGLHAGQKRRITPAIKREMRRRSAIEPVVGHIQNEHRTGRDYLAREQRDAITAILADAGYNFRVLLNWLRPSLALVPQLRALTV
jgi:hypothetical protein